MRGFATTKRLGAIACVLFAAFSCPAGAGGNDRPDGAPDAAEQWLLMQPLRLSGDRPATLADTRRVLEQIFDEQDLQGAGITTAVREALQTLPEAQQRGRLLGEALAFDLDGDGRVTRHELTLALGGRVRRYIHANGVRMKPTEAQVAAQLDKLIGEKMAADSDGDGVLTLDELIRHAKAEGRKATYAAGRLVPQEFDKDKDGTVTRAEFLAVVDRLLARIDANADGSLDLSEAVRASAWQREARELASHLLMQDRQKAQQMEKAAACALPRPSPEALIVVLAAGSGTAAADVAFALDAPVLADYANLEIAPGERPIYLVLTSLEPIVWHLSGATGRVERLVIGGAGPRSKGMPLAGVVGLEKIRIHFAYKSECPSPPLRTSLGERVRLKNEVAALLAREADDVFLHHRLAKLVLPGGTAAPAPAIETARSLSTGEEGETLRQEFLLRYPAGVAHVAAERVVASTAHVALTGLPAQAGIAELIDQGALVVTGSSRMSRLEAPPGAMAGGIGVEGHKAPDAAAVPKRKQLPVYGKVPAPHIGDEAGAGVMRKSVSIPSQLRIVRKITMPAGLKRTSGFVFVLPDGVPEPDGPTDNVCIYREMGGQLLRASPHCRPSLR